MIWNPYLQSGFLSYVKAFINNQVKSVTLIMSRPVMCCGNSKVDNRSVKLLKKKIYVVIYMNVKIQT